MTATLLPTSRDYAGEMRQLIDQHTAEGGYIPGIVASELVAKLRATDPDLLAGWLDAQAEQFVREAIGRRDRSIRAHTRRVASAREFQAATESHQAGDDTALRKYLEIPFTVADGSRWALGKLTRDDLLYVQSDYQRRADENLFYAALLGAIAKKVTTGRVEDHYTEQQMASMFEQFGR